MGFGSSCSGMEFEDGVVAVIGATVKQVLLELRHLLVQLGDGDLAFLVEVCVVFLLQVFHIFLDGAEFLSEVFRCLDLVIDFAQPAVDFLCQSLVLPETWVGCLGAELFALMVKVFEVKDSLASREVGFPALC